MPRVADVVPQPADACRSDGPSRGRRPRCSPGTPAHRSRGASSALTPPLEAGLHVVVVGVAAVHDHRGGADLRRLRRRCPAGSCATGCASRLFADATLIRYGAWTYSGMLDAFSASASSRGLGFFQLCGLPRKNCTTSAPSASAAARGSSRWTCEPISTAPSLCGPPDTSERHAGDSPPGLPHCAADFGGGRKPHTGRPPLKETRSRN